jgi:HEAT repeat protein
MTEAELYKELGVLTKNKDRWEEMIPFTASLLSVGSVKIQAKALWLLGEMGLKYPKAVREYVPAAAAFLDRAEPILRERALNALGRIGRGDPAAVEPWWADLFRFAADGNAGVRLSFLWASENIASTAPDLYETALPVFAGLLYDREDRVRMEAPEIFRVLGRRRPTLVQPYLAELRRISETDENRVVRVQCLGAIKAAGGD